MVGSTANTGVAPSPRLFPLQKTRSASSQRTWKLLFPPRTNREDGFKRVLHWPTRWPPFCSQQAQCSPRRAMRARRLVYHRTPSPYCTSRMRPDAMEACQAIQPGRRLWGCCNAALPRELRVANTSFRLNGAHGSTCEPKPWFSRTHRRHPKDACFQVQ